MAVAAEFAGRNHLPVCGLHPVSGSRQKAAPDTVTHLLVTLSDQALGSEPQLSAHPA